MAHAAREDSRVVLVTHELFAPHVIRQAELVGLKLEKGPELPEDLYETAPQWWYRQKCPDWCRGWVEF